MNLLVAFRQENEVKLKIVGCHGNRLPIKEILYQSVFGDKCYIIGHKFTFSVAMDVSPFAWCLARAVLNTRPLSNSPPQEKSFL